MIEDFQHIDFLPVSLPELLINLGTALLCGIAIALTYRYTYQGPSYARSFVQALVLLNLITAVVILVIGNNLARAFGLVGAMSIIRFRTAIKDTQDIVFIFFSLVVGMAAGVGLRQVALVATLFIGAVILAMYWGGFGRAQKPRQLLQISYQVLPEETGELAISNLLRAHCTRVQLIYLQNSGTPDAMEAHYHVQLKRRTQEAMLIQALQALPHVSTAQLFFDEDIAW